MNTDKELGESSGWKELNTDKHRRDKNFNRRLTQISFGIYICVNPRASAVSNFFCGFLSPD